MKRDLKTLLKLFLVFLKIGCFTFGGGYAMIAIIERELVEERKWITAEELSDMIIVAESTPGPIIINTATYVGYKVWGVWGGIVATLGATIPSIAVISILYTVLDAFKENRWINAAFRGMHCGVVVLLVNAVTRIVKPMPRTALTVTIGILSFLVAVFTDFSSIYLILLGGLIGIFITVVRKEKK